MTEFKFDLTEYVKRNRGEMTLQQPARTLETRVNELLAANTRLQEEARAARAGKLKAEQVAEVALDALAAAQAPKGTPVGRIVTNRSRAEEDFEAERRLVARNHPAANDDKLTKGELARAAAVYLLDHLDGLDPLIKHDLTVSLEPWPTGSGLPRRKALLVAASFLVSEVERMDRREQRDVKIEAQAAVKDELTTMDDRCSEKQRILGHPIPRTCKLCGLGPCLERRRR